MMQILVNYIINFNINDNYYYCFGYTFEKVQ